jgi:hypothetical protein
MTTVTVLAEVGKDKSMVFPTGIPLDIPVVRYSSGQYLVWYSTSQLNAKNLFFKTLGTL